MLWFVETPFSLIITAQFSEDRVVVTARVNVTFAPSQLPDLIGRRSEPT